MAKQIAAQMCKTTLGSPKQIRPQGLLSQRPYCSVRHPTARPPPKAPGGIRETRPGASWRPLTDLDRAWELQDPAVLKAKIKIKNCRIRAGIGPEPTISL